MCIMCSALNALAYLMVVSYFVGEIACRVEFTNIKCNATDLNFCDFEYCYLKSVNRSYKYVSLQVNLYKIPVTKVKVRFGLYKRFSGYRPFLYNFTVDGCNILKTPKSFPVARYFFDFIKEYTNMNHTCPFNHDAVVVDKASIEHFNNQFTNVLQFPEGDYMFEMHWLAYDINRAVIKFYLTLS